MKPEVIIALCAVVISVVSLGSSIYFGWCTRDHNRRSVKPLPYVAPTDFEDRLAVRLWNYGSGPMILRKVITRNERNKFSGHLIDLVPSPPGGLCFNNFVKVHPGRAVLPGKSIDLVEIIIDEKSMVAVGYRDQLRNVLGHLVVDVEYTDIYESQFSTYERDLTWFHRKKA